MSNAPQFPSPQGGYPQQAPQAPQGQWPQQPGYGAPPPQQPYPQPQAPQQWGPQPGYQQPPQGFGGQPYQPAPQPQFQPPPPQGGGPVGMFRGVEGARQLVRANYVRAGLYWCRIDKCKTDISRKRETFAAIEMTVVKVIDGDNGKGHRVGESVSRLIMMTSDYFLPEVKAFVAGSVGMQPEQITEHNCNEVFGPTQPLTGTVVEVQASLITTKKNTPFTTVTFKREVPAAELLAPPPHGLDPHVIATFFPGNVLNRMAEAQQANPALHPSPAPAAAPVPHGYQQPPAGYPQQAPQAAPQQYPQQYPQQQPQPQYPQQAPQAYPQQPAPGQWPGR
jgi:hypothetical protein